MGSTTAARCRPPYGSGRSTSRAVRRERDLDVSDFGTLPRGRALLIAAGIAPTFIKITPWMSGLRAQQVRASIAAHDPADRTHVEASS